MFQKEINSLNAKAYEYAKNVPVKDALVLAGYTGKFKRRGNSLFFQCPNGCDEKAHLDKCCINLSENLAHCFGCGDGWDSPRIVSMLKQIPYNHASIFIAKSGGVISEEEYEEVTKRINYKKMIVGNVRQLQATQKAYEATEYRRSDSECDLVNRHLLMQPNFRLKAEHRAYLKEVRKLTDEEIDRGGYFTYEKPIKMDELLASIRTEKPGFKASEFWGVAGFYMVFKNKERTKGYWELRKPYKNCIGIPLRNAKGEIVAFQMLNLNAKNGCNKYFFVTSKGYEEEGKNTGYGTTCGTPAHVEYPSVISNSMFMISEGHFKVHEMAKEGSVCFSCQGVNNFSYVVDEIEKCLESDRIKSLKDKNLFSDKCPLTIAITYDADMYKNIHVLQAGMKLCESLNARFPKVPVVYLLWDLNLGKGFDDMKYYCLDKGINYYDKCFVLDADMFNNYAQESIDNAIGRHKKKFGEMELACRIRTDEFKDFLYDELWRKRLAKHQH